MRIPRPILLVALAGALLVSTLLSAAPAGQSVHQASAPTDDAAAELFAAMCSKCHDAARITALRRTKTEWEEVINKMIERGATGSEEDFQTVFDFLRRHYGKVYINTANPDEMTTTLTLSGKDADAIVSYR